MVLLTEFAAVIAVYVPLTIGLMMSGESSARELRPSEHGLEFQNLHPAGGNYPPEMKSFFNSTPTSTSSDVALPKAMNSSDSSPSSWWGATGRGAGGGGRDHVKDALMVASLVCGITGGILLVVSGLLYLFKYRKHELNESRGENNNNKLQLVVRNP